MAQTLSRRRGLRSLWHHHPLKVHIAMVFTTLIFVACGVIAWSNHLQGSRLVISTAEDLIDRIDNEVSSELRHLFAPVESLVTWISDSPFLAGSSAPTRVSALPALAQVLRQHEQVAAIYIGYDDGEFFLVRALRDDASRKAFGAPQQAAFLLQSVQLHGGIATPRKVVLDADLRTIAEPGTNDPPFDPRTRPWYREALTTRDLIETAPYIFFTTREVGVTVARRAANGRAVIGADVTLSQISDKLRQVRPTPSSQLAIFDPESDRVMAFSDPARVAAGSAGDKPALVPIEAISGVLAATAAESGRFVESSRMHNGGRDWLVKASWVNTGGDRVALLGVATPLDELLVGAVSTLRRTLLLTLGVILVCVGLTWWIAQHIAGNLRALTDQAAAIRRFDFSELPLPKTRINEIFGLGRAMGDMRGTIRKFLDITTALASERNFERLLQRVLKEAHDAAGGAGGIVYLLDDEGRVLKPAAQAWEGRPASGAAALPDIRVDDEPHPIASGARGEAAAATQVLPADRDEAMRFVDACFGTVPVQLMTVPLRNRAGEMVGMLCVFLQGLAPPPSLERLALVEAFAGACAAAIDNQRLVMMQKALLESFIGLIANAIDAKSPYTGGHCQRVPELTKMLARAACEAKSGPFAQFGMDEQEWEALHLAGWLHDCGKVTTPEYVVDKATKLETIYDRIHEVRMRFEVLKRDACIACLEAMAEGGDARRLREELAETLRTLDDEFAFVATCNEGGEFMAPEKVARLQDVAARTWQRTLDDRIGLSHEEAKRKARAPAAPLPATERLLADKAEHIVERGPQDVMPEDNPWGFKLKTPTHLYNRGELYNLAIARGTLSEEERYKINDHIVQTIVMLNRLPFPKHLKTVPELAGGHHEKMDGGGYPKRLTREDMSVQARIMAIADIFEALTATDRPYKKGKMLSEAIKIMSFMKKDQHIDPELFDLFLTSGVYREYAGRYMEPQYIDDVDVGSYVGTVATAKPSSVSA